MRRGGRGKGCQTRPSFLAGRIFPAQAGYSRHRLFRPFLVVELAQQCATRFRRTEGSRALVRPCRSPSPMPRANCRQGQ